MYFPGVALPNVTRNYRSEHWLANFDFDEPEL
jgi:hypothetical protein